MRGILSDVNVDGHLERLRWALLREPHRALWLDLGLEWLTFADLGWPRDLSDDLVWERCQLGGMILVTGNRNQDGPTSLEATIRDRNTAASLPVYTIGNPDRLLNSRSYADHVAIRLLENLYESENVRGAGRLYLP